METIKETMSLYEKVERRITQLEGIRDVLSECETFDGNMISVSLMDKNLKSVSSFRMRLAPIVEELVREHNSLVNKRERLQAAIDEMEAIAKDTQDGQDG